MQIDTDKIVVEARFYVSEIKLQPFQDYDLDENNKSINHRQVMGGTVTMTAAKHGTFGKYTPFGNITMGIQNLYAFEVFKEAFERTLKFKSRNPRFKVYFVEDENQEPDK